MLNYLLTMKKLFLYYFIFLFSLLSIFSSGIIDSIDGFQYLAVARHIYYKGEPTSPPYDYAERKNIHMSMVTGKDGKSYSLTGLGFSLAYLPAVAITDLVYKIYGVSPQAHFPLENDWLIFLMASFTNAFFGAMLGVILLAFFILLKLSIKQAIFFSLISIFATNLFVYTKHSMVHMMFVTFLMLSFLLIKIYSIRKKWWLLAISGLSFGVVMITYNLTFSLAVPPLFLYYLMLTKFRISNQSLKRALYDAASFFIGAAPFVVIYFWYENLRAIGNFNMASGAISIGAQYVINKIPISVFFEGIYGQLLSPGRSIFIYSPLLLVIIFFWHKIKKNIHPEFFVFLLYSAILIIFYAKAFTVGRPDQGIEGLWHGENSWGPRYLTPLIPLGMLVVASIYKFLSEREKYFVFFPLVILGFLIEIIGVLIPYQTKYANMEKKFWINGNQYTVFSYTNIIPRHTPLLNMSKNLIKLGQNFPKTFEQGIYNVRFFDGIDFPFNVGPERWRVIEGKGYISFDNLEKDPVRELTFGMINHPVAESSSGAKLQFLLNNESLSDEPFKFKVTERLMIKLPIKENLVKPKDNLLVIIADFEDRNVLKDKGQIVAIQYFDINGQRQNIESIDVPYVSDLGPKMTGITYQNWGGENEQVLGFANKDPWRFWDIHTQTFERLPDFWWIRNLYYWDIPKGWILIPFGFNLTVLAFAAFKLKRILNGR